VLERSGWLFDIRRYPGTFPGHWQIHSDTYEVDPLIGGEIERQDDNCRIWGIPGIGLYYFANPISRIATTYIAFTLAHCVVFLLCSSVLSIPVFRYTLRRYLEGLPIGRQSS